MTLSFFFNLLVLEDCDQTRDLAKK